MIQPSFVSVLCLSALATLLAGCPSPQATPCGDGFCQVGFECVDERECLPMGTRCGDGVVDEGEGCDNGPGNDDVTPGACRSDCQPARCGDGVLDEDELPTCLRTGAEQVITLAHPGHLIAQKVARTPRAIAVLDPGATQIDVIAWPDGTAETSTIALPEPARAALWWRLGVADLLVISDSGVLHRIALRDGVWRLLESVPTGVAGVREVQALEYSLVLTSPTVAVVGALTLDGGDHAVWYEESRVEPTDGELAIARSSTGYELAAVVHTPGGDVLRSYVRDFDGWTYVERPFAGKALDLAVYAPDRDSPNEIAVLTPTSLERHDVALTTEPIVTSHTPLAWGQLESEPEPPLVFLGGGEAGLWIGQLDRGVFAERVLLEGSPASEAIVQDLDRDGWPEILQREGDVLRVRASGDGVLSGQVGFDVGENSGLLTGGPGVVLDVDHDGRFDLVRYGLATGLVQWQEGEADGALVERGHYPLAPNGGPDIDDLVSCDFDGDGRPEIVLNELESIDQTTSLGHLTGLELSASGDIPLVFHADESSGGRIAAEDFDGDGACDLLFARHDGSLRYFPGHVGAGLGEAEDLPAVFAGFLLRVDVFAADGQEPLVLIHTDTGIYWSDPTSLRAGVWLGEEHEGHRSAVLGRFTDDDVADVLLLDDTGLSLWPDRTQAKAVALTTKPMGGIPQSPRRGDLNGDGRSDFVALGAGGVYTFVARAGGAEVLDRFVVNGPNPYESGGYVVDVDFDGVDDSLSSAGPNVSVRYGQASVGVRAARARR